MTTPQLNENNFTTTFLELKNLCQKLYMIMTIIAVTILITVWALLYYGRSPSAKCITIAKWWPIACHAYTCIAFICWYMFLCKQYKSQLVIIDMQNWKKKWELMQVHVWYTDFLAWFKGLRCENIQRTQLKPCNYHGVPCWNRTSGLL